MLLDLLNTIEKIQKQIPVKTVVTFTDTYKRNDCWTGICLRIETSIKNQTIQHNHFFSKTELMNLNKEVEEYEIKRDCKQFLQSYRSYANA